MPQVARTIRKLLSWVLVLLAPLQPVLALDCSCSCKTDAKCAEKACKHEGATPAKTGRCGHSHRHVVKKSERPAKETRLACIPGCRPCHCPSDCDCHLRHANHLGSTTRAATRPAKDVAKIPLPPVTIQSDTANRGIALCPVWYSATRETSALATCALLCRFAS